MISEFREKFSFLAKQYVHEKLVSSEIQRVQRILDEPITSAQKVLSVLREVSKRFSQYDHPFSRRVCKLVREEEILLCTSMKQPEVSCIREEDLPLTIVEKEPVLEDVYVVGNGELVITPSTPRVESPSLIQYLFQWIGSYLSPLVRAIISSAPLPMTLTVKVGDSYVKIRNVHVRSKVLLMGQQKRLFNPAEWLSIGSGLSAVLIRKKEVDCFIEGLYVDPEMQKSLQEKLDTLASPETSVIIPTIKDPLKTQEVASSFFAAECSLGSLQAAEERKTIVEMLKKEGYKITCVMSPEGELVVVALRKINAGTCKVVKEVYSLWQKTAGVSNPIQERVVIAKGKLDIDPRLLLEELYVAKILADEHVPFTLRMWTIKRANAKKVGLLMEHCQGDMDTYLSGHFDSKTNTLLPQFGMEHKRIILQILEGLIQMHEKGLIHSDLKAGNILLKSLGRGLEARISDYGLTTSKRAKTRGIPGTYPPPEFMEEYELQLADYGERRPGLPVSERVDEWAFGLLMFHIMHGNRQILKKMTFEKGSLRIWEGREALLELLDLKDPIDQVIALLLDPRRPITLQKAREILLLNN